MEQGASCKERVLKLCGELVATCAPGGTREPDESEQLALLHQLRALAAAPDARASLRAALPVLLAALGGLSETRAVRTHKTRGAALTPTIAAEAQRTTELLGEAMPGSSPLLWLLAVFLGPPTGGGGWATGDDGWSTGGGGGLSAVNSLQDVRAQVGAYSTEVDAFMQSLRTARAAAARAAGEGDSDPGEMLRWCALDGQATVIRLPLPPLRAIQRAVRAAHAASTAAARARGGCGEATRAAELILWRLPVALRPPQRFQEELDVWVNSGGGSEGPHAAAAWTSCKQWKECAALLTGLAPVLFEMLWEGGAGQGAIAEPTVSEGLGGRGMGGAVHAAARLERVTLSEATSRKFPSAPSSEAEAPSVSTSAASGAPTPLPLPAVCTLHDPLATAWLVCAAELASGSACDAPLKLEQVAPLGSPQATVGAAKGAAAVEAAEVHTTHTHLPTPHRTRPLPLPTLVLYAPPPLPTPLPLPPPLAPP